MVRWDSPRWPTRTNQGIGGEATRAPPIPNPGRKKAIRRAIKPRRDRVRFYYLCEGCLARTEVTSGPEVLHETEAIVV
jgi:hypothetical protein